MGERELPQPDPVDAAPRPLQASELVTSARLLAGGDLEASGVASGVALPDVDGP